MENNDFYVYVYLDTRKKGNYLYGDYHFEYEPFYVGKGKNNRCKHHLYEAYDFRDENTKKCRKIRKIKKFTKNDPIILKLKEGLTDKQSQLLEMDLIKIIGKDNIGPLTNIADGGNDTNVGNPIKAVEYAKSVKGKTNKEIYGEERAKEISRRLSEALKGHKKPQSYIDKLVERCSKKWKITTPDNQEIIIENLSEYCRNNELDQSAMVRVSQGKRNHHKKYKCKKMEV